MNIDFSNFRDIEFPTKGIVYILYFEKGGTKTYFYVGESGRHVGRIGDYISANFKAATDFKVGEAVKYLLGKKLSVRVLYEEINATKRQRKQKEKSITDQLRKGGYTLLNDLKDYRYAKAIKDAERQKICSFTDGIIASCEQEPQKTHSLCSSSSFEITKVKKKPKKGDLFLGEINDLFHKKPDASGWWRRDIAFHKPELNSGQVYDYPSSGDYIILVDLTGGYYKCRFSKPDKATHVCLGTPEKLKPWYRRKGFSDQHINSPERDGSRDKVYFEYSGKDIEFYIYTEKEFNAKYPSLKV